MGKVAIEATRRMRAAPAAAWQLLTEPELWPSWGPTVRAVECDDRQLRLGSTGRLQTPLGVWVPFEILDLDPGHRWVWRVAGIPATGHRVEPAPDGCRVTFEVPAWAMAYVPVCELALRRIERLLGAVRA